MNTIKRFCKYMFFVIKNTCMIICLVLDIIGMLLVFFTKISIPNNIYFIILVIGFILANYEIYKENAPEINMSTSLLNKYPYKAIDSGESYINAMVNFNLYINNFGNNVGIIESIEVNLIRFCNNKDEFLLKKVGIGFKEYFVADKELFTPLEFMKEKFESKFPIILQPKTTVNKVLILYIDIEGENQKDYNEIMVWMSDIEFLVKLKTKNNNVEKNIIYKLIVSKDELEKFRTSNVKQNKEVTEYFESEMRNIK